jgi:purine nucleosidase
VAMAIALDPTIVTQQSEHYVDVETTSELTRGMTVVDRLNVAGNERNRAIWAPVLERGKKVKVYWTMDNKRWKQALYAKLR